EWARRHIPEAMLGISAEEELGNALEMERGRDGAFSARELERPSALGTLTETLEEKAGAAPASVAVTSSVPEPPLAAAPCCGKPHRPSEPCPPPDLQLKPEGAPKAKR